MSLSSSQPIDQVDSDSPINTLFLQLILQDPSLNITIDQNDTNAEKKEVFRVFYQTKSDAPLSIELFAEHNLSTAHGYPFTLKTSWNNQ